MMQLPGALSLIQEEQRAYYGMHLIPIWENQTFLCCAGTQIPYLPALHFLILPHQPELSDQWQDQQEPAFTKITLPFTLVLKQEKEKEKGSPKQTENSECQSESIHGSTYQRVNFIRIPTKIVHSISHASKINNSRYPSEILRTRVTSQWF